MRKNDLLRFWAKVRPDPTTGCWVWTAAVRTWKAEPWDGGFGAFRYRGRVVRAHIFAFRVLFGHWPPAGKVLMHGCDNRRCVNVLSHIRPGTQAENVADMIAKGRSIQQRRKATISQQGDKHGQSAAAQGASESVRPDRSVAIGSALARGRSRDDQFYPWCDGTAQ